MIQNARNEVRNEEGCCASSNAGSRKEFQETLPELHEEDIAGSEFAIQNYTVHRDLRGAAALGAFAPAAAAKRGLKLMLEFVPNAMALHHPWVDEQPDYFVRGNESNLAHAPLSTVETSQLKISRAAKVEKLL